MPVVKHVALLMNVHDPYDRNIIIGIARYVREHTQWSLHIENEPEAKIPSLRQWQGDGIIANLADLRVVQAVRRRRLPIVAVGGGYESTMRIPIFRSNNQRIAELAADHLLERGFQNFAYCGLPHTELNSYIRDRASTFKERIEAAGYPCSIYTGRHRTARRWESLHRGLMDWLASQETPLGIMACHDGRAYQVLEACRRIGAHVPEDVAVIGVDNDPITCEWSNPPLSSVIPGTNRLANEAAAMLMRLMEGQRSRHEVRLINPIGVATRQSTDVLAVTDPVVREAVRLIQEGLHLQLKVHDVVKSVSGSRSWLDNLFKQTLGRTVHDEIERLQLNRAKELILTTDLPLKQIAKKAGYGTVQYMTTILRRKLNTTPAQLREQR